MELKPYFLLMAVFVAALPAESQTTRQSRTYPSAQHFVCHIGYTQNECDEEMAVLRRALANYPAYQLGGWTWVLVRSEDWKLILLTSGLSPGAPALTVLGMRTTFFEDALLVGPISRVSELMTVWHMSREGLLDLAIRHELGHALCGSTNEVKADRVARLLEKKKPISCEGGGRGQANRLE